MAAQGLKTKAARSAIWKLPAASIAWPTGYCMKAFVAMMK